MSDFLQISTTTSTCADAEGLATLLLESRLVACAQIIGPVTSRYWWQGTLETATEWQCLFKTSRQLYVSVETQILAHHPYETPEIISVPVVEGSREYLGWLHQQLNLG
ncbi:MAG: divalent-cation tolerance protein CutA [Cyanobacteria bacterium P01_E01_bin.45]